jgi:hypothetical protein
MVLRVAILACLTGAVGSAGSVGLARLLVEPERPQAALPSLMAALGYLGAAVGAAHAMRGWVLQPQQAHTERSPQRS